MAKGFARLAFALSLAALAPAQAQQGAPSFQGRTLTVFTSAGAGGGYDLFARMLSRHMPRHLPGAPNIVVKTMLGGGGVVMANYLANVAPKDGSEFAILSNGLPYAPLLYGTQVQFDPLKMSWLGALARDVPILYLNASTGAKSFDEFFDKTVTLGGEGPGSATAGYPKALNAILGTKFKLVLGYAGSADMNLAIERGELDGVAGWCWLCMQAAKPEWISQGKVRVLLQLATREDPELTGMGVPGMLKYARTDDQKKQLELMIAGAMQARPFAAPPGLPEPVLATLRKAFDAVARDPEFLAEADKAGLHVDYTPWEEQLATMRRIYATDPALVDILKQIFAN